MVDQCSRDCDGGTFGRLLDSGLGVRLGGGSAWDTNAAARARGLPRVVPKDSMDFGPLDLWEGYQRRLAEGGAVDPTFESDPAYCALGATTDVPAAASAPASGPQ